jgi:hypothetical protein
MGIANLFVLPAPDRFESDRFPRCEASRQSGVRPRSEAGRIVEVGRGENNGCQCRRTEAVSDVSRPSLRTSREQNPAIAVRPAMRAIIMPPIVLSSYLPILGFQAAELSGLTQIRMNCIRDPSRPDDFRIGVHRRSDSKYLIIKRLTRQCKANCHLLRGAPRSGPAGDCGRPKFHIGMSESRQSAIAPSFHEPKPAGCS